jgi:hypothetical protein
MNKLNSVTKACGVFLLWATAAVALPAQTFTTLYSFDNTPNGSAPSGLIQGTDGNLYGTAEEREGLPEMLGRSSRSRQAACLEGFTHFAAK